jgi:hypothetical protein
MPLSARSPSAGHDLSELQFDILDALYFVEPYQSLLSEVMAQSGASEQLIVADLKQLIAWRYVQVLRYDEHANDWLKTPFHDADDLHAFRYLATKEGLLVHNGRR